MELKDIRNTIDQIDDQMLELFVRRMEVARDVAAYKKEHGLPILDSGREREVLNRVTEKAGEGLERYAKLLYQTMFDLDVYKRQIPAMPRAWLRWCAPWRWRQWPRARTG